MVDRAETTEFLDLLWKNGLMEPPPVETNWTAWDFEGYARDLYGAAGAQEGMRAVLLAQDTSPAPDGFMKALSNDGYDGLRWKIVDLILRLNDIVTKTGT